MFKYFLSAALIATAGLAAAGDRATLLETIQSNPNLSTLADILETADLTATLADDGPFTLYAPTDDAFAAMPEGTLAALQLPENTDRLADILRYHVDDRKLTSRHLAPGAAYYRPILADTRLCVINDDGVTIDDGSGEIATVTEANIKVSNGVIHLIDKVLVPAEKPVCEMS
ncbi:MAG: fasciclin domain-containing protein [Pseudomonadota bacterium]